MAAFSMSGVLALQFQADTIVTLSTGSYTVTGGQSITFGESTIDIPSATVVAVMRNATSPGGEILQCFRADAIITVA